MYILHKLLLEGKYFCRHGRFVAVLVAVQTPRDQEAPTPAAAPEDSSELELESNTEVSGQWEEAGAEKVENTQTEHTRFTRTELREETLANPEPLPATDDA